jgi:hypothetical protein
MNNEMTICIAGKNNIAVTVAEYILKEFKEVTLIACCNATDNGKNGFQRSFKSFCTQHQVPVKKLEELYSISNLIFLSLEYDRIIRPSNFLTEKLYNIHFSYLPAYKGMYTSALPILNSETYTGVTLHKIDVGIDTGDIIAQKKIEILQDFSGQDLYLKYIEEGTKLVIENIENILNNKIIAIPQSSFQSSYYSKKTIDYTNLRIDTNKTAFEIQSQIRAFTFPAYQLPIIGGTKVYKSLITNVKTDKKAGTIISETDFELCIATIDYDLILYKDLRDVLFASAKDGNIEVLHKFIEEDYDIHQRSKEGWDIAMITAYNGKYTYLEYLLNEKGWDINVVNNNGTTLLMYLMTDAATNNHILSLKNFIDTYKPILHQKDYYGNDVFYYAEKYKNEKVIKLLKKYLK